MCPASADCQVAGSHRRPKRPVPRRRCRVLRAESSLTEPARRIRPALIAGPAAVFILTR